MSLSVFAPDDHVHHGDGGNNMVCESHLSDGIGDSHILYRGDSSGSYGDL